MARVHLGFTDEEFFDCSPRRLISMITQWNIIEGRKEPEAEKTAFDIIDSLPIREV